MDNSAQLLNNLTFGNDRYQYYETITDGSGAGGAKDQAAKANGRASTAWYGGGGLG